MHICALLLLLAAEPDIDVMVLGTYHMANPGQDLAGAKADDVTQPKRQKELDALARALAEWKPTKILVESQQPAPFTVAEYRAFKPADLKTKHNETVQIGYRLANLLGQKEVYGFDEQPTGTDRDYFPFDKVDAYARAHGQGAKIDAMMTYFQGAAAAQEKDQASHSIAQLLLAQNDPSIDKKNHGIGYYGLLSIGDADAQPGAELNAYWYMRNAKMFAKLALIAKPGDRVLVVVGAGHRYWLTQLASLAPGFRNVEPKAALEKAAR